MAKLKRIVKFLDEYLNIDEIEDNSWNGLQIEGNPVVEKALFAVDAGMETFTTAVGENADLIVVHHGHFWKNLNPSVTEWAKERIEILYEHKISLYACHLPLDKHREIGNNAQLLRLLGARIKEEF
ncbi:MAG TPA: Nif3-like dinuclear metal center hexameric protein, partial [Candidatus Omnitrophica bacterium]|nr:Nif3-like dinuclear metal center hexameric protein [Candidatus Omnitrophota bacterium]